MMESFDFETEIDGGLVLQAESNYAFV